MQRFIIRWRVWLTHRLTGDWLDGDAYYRGRFVDDPIDNPDQRIQQDIDIFTTGTGPETNTPTVGTAQTLLFSGGICHCVAGRVHPDSVGSGGPADALRCHRAEGAVLDGVGLCVLHDGRRVLDRPPADPAVLPQRAHQRRVPLRIGAAARCGRGCRPLPRRRCRTRSADDPIRGRHRQLPCVRAPQYRVPRLEPVDEPDRRPAPTMSFRPPGCSTVRSSSATSPSRRKRFDGCTNSLAFFRNVYDAFAGYRAAIIRLDGLITVNETARELPSLTALPSADGSVQLDDVEVRTPAGIRLIDPSTCGSIRATRW